MSTIPKGVLQPKPSSFHWTIKRFFADCNKHGSCHTSPVFTIHYSGKVTKWFLKAYPNGNNDESEGSVSLFLYFLSENVTDVTVDYQLTILNKENNQIMLNGAIETFEAPEDHWGWSKFVKQDAIKKGVSNDTLKVLCDITFLDKDVAESIKVYDHLLDNIGKGLEDYEKLLETRYFSDVTFVVQDTKMYLHRNILMCRNATFKAMFEPYREDKRDSLVQIKDVSCEVMTELFRFIYSGKVRNIDKIAKDLLIAADKYSIVELKALCEKTLYVNLTVDNALECFSMTDTCDTIHLKTLVIQFMADHYKELVEKPEFANVNSNVMLQIMQAIAKKSDC